VKTEEQIINEMCVTFRKDYNSCTPEKQWAIKQWMTWLLERHKQDIALLETKPTREAGLAVLAQVMGKHATDLYIEADAVRVRGVPPRSVVENTKAGLYIDVFCGECHLGLCAIVEVREINNTLELEVPKCPRCAGVLK
jgi:hypothetical protein